MKEINYKLYYNDKSPYNEVISILKSTNNDFIPALSSKYSLETIANKYIEKAPLYIAYLAETPIGLVAFYPNEKPNDSYLSLITVTKEYRGLNIGKKLETLCIAYCRKKNSKGLLVNMRKSNKNLLHSRFNIGYSLVKEYKLEYSV